MDGVTKTAVDAVAKAAVAKDMGRERKSRRFILVANRTGGQGKTLLAHLLASELRRTDPGFRVMCADSVEPVANGGRSSKLGRCVSGVLEVGSGPTPSEVQADPRLALEFWDAIGTPLLDRSRSGCLMDVGANVIDPILDWARTADLDAVLDGSIVTDLVVPIVATAKSVSDARDVVANAIKPGGLPIGTVFVVENGWQGPFGPLSSNSDYQGLLTMSRQGGGKVVAMPACRSAVLPEVERGHLYLGDVAEWDFNEAARSFGWELIKASRELRTFTAWMRECAAALSAAGLTDPEGGLPTADHQGGRSRDQRPI